MSDKLKLNPIETAPTDGTPFLGYGLFEWNSMPKASAETPYSFRVVERPDYWEPEDTDWMTDWERENPDQGFRTVTENPYKDYARLIGWLPLPEVYL